MASIVRIIKKKKKNKKIKEKKKPMPMKKAYKVDFMRVHV